MKLKEVTPKEMMCHTSSCCPAVFETDNGSYVVIGKKLDANVTKQLEGRVAEDEFVVEIPKGMIDGLK